MLLGNFVIFYLEIERNFYRAKLLRQGKHMKSDTVSNWKRDF